MKQREIEKNILNGNIEFEKSISRDSKEVMIALLNGNKDLRPGANQVLKFPYFAKRIQYLSKKLERNSNRSISSNALENENKELKKKLEEMEKLLREKEMALMNSKGNFKNLQKKNQSLEIKIQQLEKSGRGSRRYLKGTFNSSVGIVNENSMRGGGFFGESLPKKTEKSGKNRSKKLEIEKQKREIKALKEENKMTKLKAQKLESDIKILENELKGCRSLNIKFFDKHKGLSVLISDFYERFLLENPNNNKTQDKLDFDDMFKKLETIFEQFKLNKNRIARNSENPSNMIQSSNTYSTNSQSKRAN